LATAADATALADIERLATGIMATVKFDVFTRLRKAKKQTVRERAYFLWWAS